MLSNIELLDKKLTYTLTNPFDMLLKQNKKAQKEPISNIWQGIADALQTAAIASNEDYTLKDLAETFNLSGTLLAAKI